MLLSSSSRRSGAKKRSHRSLVAAVRQGAVLGSILVPLSLAFSPPVSAEQAPKPVAASKSLLAAKEVDSAPASLIQIDNVEKYSELDDSFHKMQEWNGADSASSVALNAERAVWFFGDTMINPAAESDSTKETKPVMINSSASWLDNYGAALDMKFFWRTVGNVPQPIFTPPAADEWYWPGTGIVHDGDLFLFTKRVKRAGNPKDGEWDFDWYADDMLRLSPGEAEPNTWKQTAKSLPESGGKILFGTACVDDDRYCYVYCSSKKDAGLMSPHPAIVARIAKDKLADWTESDWGFWADEPKMFVPASDRATVLIPDAAPEMSVTYIPTYHCYVAVYIPPLSDSILLRTAPQPWGPFSSAVSVYRCPEAAESADGKNVLVYSAKEHPELRRAPNELVISYCSNPGALRAHSARPDLYFPRAVRVKLKAPTQAEQTK